MAEMINPNDEFIVSNEFKYEYQEGTVTEIKINCADGTHIMVRIVLWSNCEESIILYNLYKIKSHWNIQAHDYVLGFASKYLRLKIKKARENTNNTQPVELDYTKYPFRTVKVFLF